MKDRAVRCISTILWVRELQVMFGGVSLGELERQILACQGRDISDFWVNYSKRFRHYISGRRTPSSSFIEFMEGLAPRSSAIFDHPLWDILRSPMASADQLHLILLRLAPNIYRRVFRGSKRSGCELRRMIRGVPYFEGIGRESSLDSLAALLVLIREAEINDDYPNFVDAQWEARDLISRLSLVRHFNEIAVQLNELVDARFLRRTLPFPPRFPCSFFDEDSVGPLAVGPKYKLDVILVSKLFRDSIRESPHIYATCATGLEVIQVFHAANWATKRDDNLPKIKEDQFDLFPAELKSERKRVIYQYKYGKSDKEKGKLKNSYRLQVESLAREYNLKGMLSS
ncbi:hypothetical protein [Agaribacterium haliotis]|uniref:hypothetical protein n=1 Tax=Agaribacterium haliotis TaxID=2013869 RepID=UPI00117868B7|nr:hypothetical protein [Agaribacterium haliotis]